MHRVIEYPSTAPASIEVRLVANLTGVAISVWVRPTHNDPLAQRDARSLHLATLEEALDALPDFCRELIADEAAAAQPKHR